VTLYITPPLSKLKTQNSKLKTQNSKLKTQNSKLKTQNSKLKTQNSKKKFFFTSYLLPLTYSPVTSYL